MEFHAWNKDGTTAEISEKEKQGYIDYVKMKNPGQVIEYIIVRFDGDFADLEYKIDPKPFERIRRITGYLVGDTRYWNNAKRAEEEDRVKHG